MDEALLVKIENLATGGYLPHEIARKLKITKAQAVEGMKILETIWAESSIVHKQSSLGTMIAERMAQSLYKEALESFGKSKKAKTVRKVVTHPDGEKTFEHVEHKNPEGDYKFLNLAFRIQSNTRDTVHALRFTQEYKSIYGDNRPGNL